MQVAAGRRRRPSSIAASVHTVPAVPTSVGAFHVAGQPRARRRRAGRARPTPPGSAPRRSADRSAGTARSAARSRCRSRSDPSGSSVPDDELGRAAADVDDEVRTRFASRLAVAPRNSSRASSSPRAARAARRAPARPGSKKSSRLLASRAALVAVARTRSTPRSSMTPRYSRSDRERALDRVGMQRPVAVDTLAEAGDLRAPLDRHELRVATAAVDVGHEEPGRVRAHVDRGDPRHCRFSSTQRPDRIVAAREVIREVRVQALHAAAGAAHAPARPGPDVVGRRARRRARARSARARRRARPASTAASAARTPPADSSRATRSERSGSTSQ